VNEECSTSMRNGIHRLELGYLIAYAGNHTLLKKVNKSYKYSKQLMFIYTASVRLSYVTKELYYVTIINLLSPK